MKYDPIINAACERFKVTPEEMRESKSDNATAARATVCYAIRRGPLRLGLAETSRAIGVSVTSASRLITKIDEGRYDNAPHMGGDARAVSMSLAELVEVGGDL